MTTFEQAPSPDLSPQPIPQELLTDHRVLEMKQYQTILDEIHATQIKLSDLSFKDLANFILELMKPGTQSSEIQNPPSRPILIAILACYLTAWNQEHSNKYIQPYDTQLVGAVALMEAKPVQMNTGEGKTIMLQLALIAQAVEQRIKSSHEPHTPRPANILVTANAALSERDSNQLQALCEPLNLLVGRLYHRASQIWNPTQKSWEIVDDHPAPGETDIQVTTIDQLAYFTLQEAQNPSSTHLLSLKHPNTQLILDELDTIQPILEQPFTLSVNPSRDEILGVNLQIKNISEMNKILLQLDPVLDYVLHPFTNKISLTPRGSQQIWSLMKHSFHFALLNSEPFIRTLAELKSSFPTAPNPDPLAAGEIEDLNLPQHERLIQKYKTLLTPNMDSLLSEFFEACKDALSLSHLHTDVVEIHLGKDEELLKLVNDITSALKTINPLLPSLDQDFQNEDSKHHLSLSKPWIAALRELHWVWQQQRLRTSLYHEDQQTKARLHMESFLETPKPEFHDQTHFLKHVLENAIANIQTLLTAYQLIPREQYATVDNESNARSVPINAWRLNDGTNYQEMIDLALAVINESKCTPRSNNSIAISVAQLLTLFPRVTGTTGTMLSPTVLEALKLNPDYLELPPYWLWEVTQSPDRWIFDPQTNSVVVKNIQERDDKQPPSRFYLQNHETKLFPNTITHFEFLFDLMFSSSKEINEKEPKEAKSISSPSRPPTLVLFRSDAHLIQFLNYLKQKGVDPSAYQSLLASTIHENPEQEKVFIQRAGEAGTISLTTPLAGRGTDIQPSPYSLATGGLQVIIAHMPKDEKTFLQFSGRTQRQGQPGKMSWLVPLDDPILQSPGKTRRIANETMLQLSQKTNPLPAFHAKKAGEMLDFLDTESQASTVDQIERSRIQGRPFQLLLRRIIELQEKLTQPNLSPAQKQQTCETFHLLQRHIILLQKFVYQLNQQDFVRRIGLGTTQSKQALDVWYEAMINVGSAFSAFTIEKKTPLSEVRASFQKLLEIILSSTDLRAQAIAHNPEPLFEALLRFARSERGWSKVKKER